MEKVMFYEQHPLKSWQNSWTRRVRWNSC